MSTRKQRDGTFTWLLPCIAVVALFAWPLFCLPGPLKLLEIPWLALLAAIWTGMSMIARARRRASQPPRPAQPADADPVSGAARR